MIGDRIKYVRDINKMSQDDFAKSLNVSKQDVFNWENNYIIPPIDIVKAIALKYRVSADFLLTLVDHL